MRRKTTTRLITAAAILMLAVVMAMGVYLVIPQESMVVGEVHRIPPILFDGRTLGLEDKALDDFNLLLRSLTHSGSANGHAAKPSESFLAFARLLRRDDAIPIMAALVEHSHSAGKLYGMDGLRVLDRNGAELR